jgi:hypothetical protein
MAINNNNSTSRSQLQTILNNPYAIKSEIQRFESVHPSIYAIYDLIELIPDIQVATQIREHIVNIEGLFYMIILIYLSMWDDDYILNK